MDKKFIPVILLIALLILLVLIKINSTKEYPITEVCIKDSCFQVELAETLEERQQGLMYRTELQESGGMLFIFPEEGEYGFWMKNTLIPLELIYMNESFGVVEIAQLQPCKNDPCNSYLPVQAATYVLEVNEGFAGRHNISVGSKLLS